MGDKIIGAIMRKEPVADANRHDRLWGVVRSLELALQQIEGYVQPLEKAHAEIVELQGEIYHCQVELRKYRKRVTDTLRKKNPYRPGTPTHKAFERGAGRS